MRRALAAFLAVLALGALGTTWAAPAHAEAITGSVDRVGWWTKRLGAQPTTDTGSFEVAYGSDKAATSVAAIEVSVPVATVQTLQISLDELTGTAAQIGHVRVCLATPGWATANAGAFDQAPALDCAASAADLTRSLDGNWLGDIGALVPNGGTVSLGIILVDDLGAPVSPGATVQISKVTIEGQAGPPLASTTTTTTPSPPIDLGGAAGPGPVFVPDTGGAFDLPPLSPADTGDGRAGTPPTTTPVSDTVDEVALPTFHQPAKPWWRLVLIVPLAIGLGFGAVFGRRLLVARGVSFA